MYQEYFDLKSLPFGLTPDTQFFCHSREHLAALNTAKICLQQGEGFIKIVGEVGSGKTLLCRLLLNDLPAENYLTAYLPNPHVQPEELPRMIAKELGIPGAALGLTAHELQETLYKHLIDINLQGKTTVLLIDEAQAMPVETLEALRLITNLEAETHKLLQIILLGQPELNDKLNLVQLRQLKQRIAFSYELKALRAEEVKAYIRHRLGIAGHTQGNLFTDKAMNKIFKYSGGIPRIINILCHKALLICYGLGEHTVKKHHVHLAKKDTEFAATYSPPSKKWWNNLLNLIVRRSKKRKLHELN